ncbi:MAG: hypothetical protein L0H81_05795 [Actinomyces sp.]|nr:hypothetical protein [Actinomyces sp.]
MATLDAHFASDITLVGSHEASLNSLNSQLTTWRTSLGTGRSSASGAWWGESADAFDARAREIENSLDDIAELSGQYSAAVSTFLRAMEGVKVDLEGILTDARAGGLPVAGTTVMEPVAPTFLQAPGTPVPTAQDNPRVAAYERELTLFGTLSGRLEGIRSAEARAHNAFQRDCERVSAPRGWDFVWSSLGITGGIGAGFFVAAQNLPDAANAAGTVVVERFGRFAYREGGRYAKLPPGFRSTLEALDNPRNWQNVAGATSAQRGWVRFGKGAKVFGRRVAPVLTAAFALGDAWQGGAEQWEMDTHDPTLSTSARVTRSVAAGFGDAAAPLAGALGGAAAGAAIGSVVPGVGTAVGAVVGGIIGGFIGGWGGQAAADATETDREEWIDDSIRW